MWQLKKMAACRFPCQWILVLLTFFTVVCFMMWHLFDVVDMVNGKSMFSRNFAVRTFFKYTLGRESGGSRANHSIPAVDELIDWYMKQDIFDSKFTLRADERYADFLKRINLNRPIGARLHLDLPDNGSSWERFYREIDQFALYDPNKQKTVEDLLLDLATRPIVKTEARLEYKQATLLITLSDGAVGVFKGKRFGRDYQTHPDLKYFSEFDRHNAEIAAFHLDRILGFYRAPPTVGRKVNASSEIMLVPNVVLYKSPVGNSCFLVKGSQYHISIYGLCGDPHMLEGSLAITLPGRTVPVINKDDRHPWARTYNMLKAPWELSEGYCEKVVKPDLKFNHGRILLDLMDMAVFDYLTGNMNRPTYERFPEFAEDTFVFHIDNAGGFAKANYDCNSCLAPIRQCCMIRQSTMVKLIKLYQGPDSLSDVLRTSLNSDPISPILHESHLDAVDRRLGKVIKTVSDCISNSGSWDSVVIDDGVY